MEPVDFVPVFRLAILVAVAHEVTFSAAFEHGLKNLVPQGLKKDLSIIDYAKVSLPHHCPPPQSLDVSADSCGTG